MSGGEWVIKRVHRPEGVQIVATRAGEERRGRLIGAQELEQAEAIGRADELMQAADDELRARLPE